MIGAIAVAGVIATTSVQSVSADTTTTTNGNDTQAVKTTDVKQDGKQVALQPTQSKDTAVKTETTPQVKSDVPTSVPSGTTQEKAKDTVDKAQDTVKGSADDAKKAGVEVTQKPTQDVTINQGNAVDETNKVLSDLNKQDQAIKQATATQQANTQAKQSGVQVTEKTEKVTPKFKDLKGLTGKALTDAMAHNIGEYNKAIERAVSKEKQDTKTIQALRQERDKAMADYRTELARVTKVNTDRKNAYDKLVLDRETAIKAAIAKGDQHYTGTYDLNGYYGGFLNGKVHYDYTYHWDNAKRTFVVTKVDIRFDSQSPDKKGAGFWDTVYVQGPKFAIPQDSAKGHIQGGADITENGDTLWQQIKNPKYGVLFYLSQNNKTGQVVVHQDNTAGVPYEAVQLPNGDYELARFISRNRQGNPGVRDSEYANWIIGNKVVAHSDIPTESTPPTYEKEPVEPAPLKGTATYYEVETLPKADTPAPQKLSFNLYNVKTTPVSVETPKTYETPKVTPTVAPAPQAKVTQASALPQTSAKEQGNGSLLGALATIGSLSLLGVMSKFKKKH